MALEGIDISNHNGKPDFSAVAQTGISFVIAKAAEGTGFWDPEFQRNRVQAEGYNLLFGMYHFYHHDLDPVAQARFFRRVTGGRSRGELQPFCDIERQGDGAGKPGIPAQNVARIGAYLDAVRDLFGCDPIIYSYPYAWAELTANTRKWAGVYPFWTASYRPATPQLFGTDTWTFWQYTSTGYLRGVGGVDRDRFNGSLPLLRKFAGF